MLVTLVTVSMFLIFSIFFSLRFFLFQFFQSVNDKDITEIRVTNPTEGGNSNSITSIIRSITTSNHSTPEAMIAAGSLVVLDEEMGAAIPMDPQEELDNYLLQLPSHAGNASRTVPGGCAICLCPYEEGDVVSWSTETACKHAFHQGKRRH
jgi:hypothetical protein